MTQTQTARTQHIVRVYAIAARATGADSLTATMTRIRSELGR